MSHFPVDALGARGLRGEPVPADRSAGRAAVYGQIRNREGRQVVKEMRALRRLDLEIVEVRLDERRDTRDLRPRHWNSEPRISRAPASRTDEQVAAAFAAQCCVPALQCAHDLARP